MTFSLVGMCRRTGMFGAAVTTSNMNVGTRCPFAKAGIGAVLTQHRTDNRLGPKGLALLEEGKTSSEVIDCLAAENPTIGWRQLAVVGALLVTLVTDGMAHLVVDQILPVGTDVTLKWHRAAHPAGRVEEHAWLALEHRVVAGSLERDVVAAAFPNRHR